MRVRAGEPAFPGAATPSIAHAERGRARLGGSDGGRAARRNGLVPAIVAAAGRSLEAEADRWSLWIPVLFATGVLAYFALPPSPIRSRR